MLGQATPEQLGPSPTMEALLPHWARRHTSILPAQNMLNGLLRGGSEIKEKDERGTLSRWSAGIGFAISMFSIVAAKVLERTGSVPLPKDVNLLEVIG